MSVKRFIVEFTDRDRASVCVTGKGRHSAAMKVVGMRATKAIASGVVKSITEQKPKPPNE